MGDAWALLGLSEFETRNYVDAQAHLERADSLKNISDAEIQRVIVYHLALLLIHDGAFERASALLLDSFGGETHSSQVNIALGLALLRIQLLPDEVDPSHEALIAEAGSLAARGDQTITVFPAFLEAYPKTPNAHLAYGLALERTGKDQDALKEFRQETVVSPNNPLPWLEISRLELRRGDTRASQAAATKAAEAGRAPTSNNSIYAMDRSQDKNQGNSGATVTPVADSNIWSRAMNEYAAREYAKAVADLRTFLKQHNDDGTGWAVLGLSEFSLGDHQSALLHLQRGASLGLQGSPESLKLAKYTTGILLLQAGQFDQAGDILRGAARAFPNDEKVRFALGMCLLRRAELPDHTLAAPELINTAGRIEMLLEDSKYDEAFPLFKSLIRRYPSMPFLHYAYGTALMALSEFEEAAVQMKLETAVSPNSELPLLRLASIGLRQHKPSDAAAPAAQAVTLSPESPEAHYLLGRAWLEAGDNAKAINELQQANKLYPDSPEIHFNLARAYAKAKMAAAAATERAAFVRLNELAEREKSQNGDQIYTGPRDPAVVRPVATSKTQASPNPP